MNDQLAAYIRKHMMMVLTISVIGFLVLAAGEYFLYRQQMHLNQMVSEGFMQMKEAQEEEMYPTNMNDGTQPSVMMEK